MACVLFSSYVFVCDWSCGSALGPVVLTTLSSPSGEEFEKGGKGFMMDPTHVRDEPALRYAALFPDLISQGTVRYKRAVMR